MGLFGTMFSLPYMLLFFFLWILASLFWPFTVATLLLAALKPLAFARKMMLFWTTILYLSFCNDKKWKIPKDDPEKVFRRNEGASIESKTIVLVRHGESAWNDTFNKGNRSKGSFIINFIPNLIRSVAYEWYFFITGQDNESWFYDSPLSDKGKLQAEGVLGFLAESLEFKTPREAELIRYMLGDSKSQMVSSNLRRSISTMAIGFQDRLRKRGDSILILPELQEISRNPDALSITPPKGKVLLAWTDPSYLQSIYDKQIDTSFHTGNKPVTTNGLKRLQAFCDLVFDDEVISKDAAVVVSGHSLWFRSFFRTYLPRMTEHVSKKRKLVNGGCVGLSLQRIQTDDGSYCYMIDPRSITVLYGGF
jgi:hypothetical protein